MKKITGGVTAAKGFQAAAVAAGIKYKDRDDMALIYSERPCVLAGTFTSNVVKAAPVLFDKKVVEESPYGQAVVINAGIANACTGREGFSYCEQTAKAAAEALSISENAVLVASTGVIGMQLPMDKLKAGITAMAPELSGTIDDVTDSIEDVLLRLYMFNIRTLRPEAQAFAQVIADCCAALKTMMEEFPNFRRSKTIHTQIVEINGLEEQGDKLYTDAMHTLYADASTPVDVMAWTALFDRLEKCCDKCEDVADVVERVILKNS